MLRLFLPKTPGFKIMNVSIFDTFTDSPPIKFKVWDQH